MIDITPELLASIKTSFNGFYHTSPKIKRLKNMLETGHAAAESADEYAVEVGNALAKAFRLNVSSDVLPDGKMYYNIAERVLSETLGNTYQLTTDFANELQNQLNKSVGLGIKSVGAELDKQRISDIVEIAANADVYDDVANVLEESIINFSMESATNVLKNNILFQQRSGLNPKVKRTYIGRHREHTNYKGGRLVDCVWCKSLAGSYIYTGTGSLPDDLFKRHDQCRCTVVYDGVKLNANRRNYQ